MAEGTVSQQAMPTYEEIEEFREGYGAVQRFLSSQPFTIGDFLDRDELVGWHKLECWLTGKTYDPEYYGDEEDSDDDDDNE